MNVFQSDSTRHRLPPKWKSTESIHKTLGLELRSANAQENFLGRSLNAATLTTQISMGKTANRQPKHCSQCSSPSPPQDSERHFSEKCHPWHRTSLIKDDNSSEAEWDVISSSLPFIVVSRSVTIRAVCSRILLSFPIFSIELESGFKIMFSLLDFAFHINSCQLQWHLHARAHLISYRLPHCWAKPEKPSWLQQKC